MCGLKHHNSQLKRDRQEGSWGWPGKAAGESMENMRERETWNLQERAEAALLCPRVARKVSLGALT